MNDYIKYLSELIPEKDSLKIVKTEAKQYYKNHIPQECYEIYPELYASDNFQIQEVGVFLAGYVADEYPDALVFLHDTVSRHPSWKVQELNTWDLSSKQVKQVHKLAGKFVIS